MPAKKSPRFVSSSSSLGLKPLSPARAHASGGALGSSWSRLVVLAPHSLDARTAIFRADEPIHPAATASSQMPPNQKLGSCEWRRSRCGGRPGGGGGGGGGARGGGRGRARA